MDLRVRVGIKVTVNGVEREGSPRTLKFRLQSTNVEQMVIMMYDWEGVLVIQVLLQIVKDMRIFYAKN